MHWYYREGDGDIITWGTSHASSQDGEQEQEEQPEEQT